MAGLAGTIYDESVSGDFSGSGLSPTLVTPVTGANQVFGATGRGANGVDRDYFYFTVPAGLELHSLTVLPGTTTGGALSFIGMESGTQVTVPPNAADATGLLGWHHYSVADNNTDILDDMSIPAAGSSGFAIPLGPGDYAFWVQDFSAGTFNYGFNFVLGSAPGQSVPDAGPGRRVTIAVLLLTAIGMGFRRKDPFVAT